MRVVAGAAKGRPLRAPKGTSTRPLTGRAKESLFSSLGAAVKGAEVLDLYAGTGSIGLEALSRGASRCVFVERDRRALSALRHNVEAVGLGGEIVADDVDRFLQRTTADAFDLVFVDPPYALPLASVAAVLDQLQRHLAPGAIVVVHRRSGGTTLLVPDRLEETDCRTFGDSELRRYRRKSDDEEDM